MEVTACHTCSVLSGSEIQWDTARYSEIQRDTARYVICSEIQWDTTRYTAGYIEIQRDNAMPAPWACTPTGSVPLHHRRSLYHRWAYTPQGAARSARDSATLYIPIMRKKYTNMNYVVANEWRWLLLSHTAGSWRVIYHRNITVQSSRLCCQDLTATAAAVVVVVVARCSL